MSDKKKKRKDGKSYGQINYEAIQESLGLTAEWKHLSDDEQKAYQAGADAVEKADDDPPQGPPGGP